MKVHELMSEALKRFQQLDPSTVDFATWVDYAGTMYEDMEKPCPPEVKCLELIRKGHLSEALPYMGRSCMKENLPGFIRVTHWRESPVKFVEDIRAIINLLKDKDV